MRGEGRGTARSAMAGVLLALAAARAGAQAREATRIDLADVARRAQAGDTSVARVVGRSATVLEDGARRGLRLDERGGVPGHAWLANVALTTGAIEVLVRGQDVPQRSFVGVSFGGDGAGAYEAVYLRPFNFRSADSTRRAHAIQYEALPAQPWSRLRAERSGQFERAVTPAPDPNGWLRLRVEVAADSVRAFIDDRLQLAVPRLGAGRGRAVGLHVGAGSGGEFAELVVR